MSNDTANRLLNRVQVVPLSSRTERVHPAQMVLDVAGGEAKAMSDQLTTVSKLRLRNRLGVLSRAQLAAVESTIRLQLALA